VWAKDRNEAKDMDYHLRSQNDQLLNGLRRAGKKGKGEGKRFCISGGSFRLTTCSPGVFTWKKERHFYSEIHLDRLCTQKDNTL